MNGSDETMTAIWPYLLDRVDRYNGKAIVHVEMRKTTKGYIDRNRMISYNGAMEWLGSGIQVAVLPFGGWVARTRNATN